MRFAVETTIASRKTPKVRRGGPSSLIGGCALLAAVLVLALVVPYAVSLGTLINLVGLFVLVILGTTWNLLAGYGGLVSVGQQGFVGAGGYATVWIANELGVGVLPSMALAAVVCAALALPTSFLLFRLVGGYFAIGTWVVSEVFRLVTTQFDALGGGSGMSLTAFAGVDRVSRIAQVYWTSLALAVVVVLATWLLMRSRMGLGLTAIRDDATAAAGLGVGVRRAQRIVYVSASAGAGLAGALLAVNGLRVTPDSIFSVQYTAAMIFIVVIGGLGSIEGPILGAVLYYVIQQQLQDQGVWYLVVLGAVAILAVMVFPKGLWGLLSGNGTLQVFPVGYRVNIPRGGEQ
jgi:branched-chain amino acid transport system permease protein